jgi:hypothetical protein
MNMKTKLILIIALISLTVFFCKIGIANESSNVNTDKEVYNYGESIKVAFSNAPGNEKDWICIVPDGSPDNEPGNYQNMPKGLTKGTLRFDAPPPGRYEVRAYYDYKRNGYVVSGRCKFSVASTPECEAALREKNTGTEVDVMPISDTNKCQFIKTAYFEVSHPSKMHYYAALNTAKAGGNSYKVQYSGEEKVFGLLVLKTNIAIYKCKKEAENIPLQNNSVTKRPVARSISVLRL